jgi:serine/threonine protein kinase
MNDDVHETSISPPSEELQRTQTVGTIPWMAPEFIDRGSFSERSDIFSFGIMLYEMFNSLA